MNPQFKTTSPQRSARGSAMIVVVVLLSIMMILVTASLVAERNLGQELKQIEKKQLNRLEGGHTTPAKVAGTNSFHG